MLIKRENSISAIWLLPQSYKYGDWPRSGEITLVESRGNWDYSDSSGQIGNERVTSTLHWGPAWNQNAYRGTQYTQNRHNGYNDGYHKYEMEWTDDHIRFKIDGNEIGTVWANNGFWSRGGFHGHNLWEHGSKMAPFDQQVRSKDIKKETLILMYLISVPFRGKFSRWRYKSLFSRFSWQWKWGKTMAKFITACG